MGRPGGDAGKHTTIARVVPVSSQHAMIEDFVAGMKHGRPLHDLEDRHVEGVFRMVGQPAGGEPLRLDPLGPFAPLDLAVVTHEIPHRPKVGLEGSKDGGLAKLAVLRHHQGGEDAEHHDHDHQIDESKPGPVETSVPRQAIHGILTSRGFSQFLTVRHIGI